jgi:hypothetical protein
MRGGGGAAKAGRVEMRSRRHFVEQSVRVHASPARVWREITEVDLESFGHPAYLSLLGIPRPVRAELLGADIGGTRIATFSNGMRFSQVITDWRPHERFAFTFRADPGFRVARVLDLSRGPFLMSSGAYRIMPEHGVVRLFLSSEYELRGVLGRLLAWPARLVLLLFQAHLLRGIKRNAERRELIAQTRDS